MSESSEISDRRIEFLKDNLAYLFKLLSVFKELRGKYRYVLGEDLAKILISSVGRNFLLGLAALLDPVEDKSGNKNISIHAIGEVDLVSYQETVAKLRKFRSKVIAHNDRETMELGEIFFREHDLQVEEAEKLLIHLTNKLEEKIGASLPRSDIQEKLQRKLKEILDCGK